MYLKRNVDNSICFEVLYLSNVKMTEKHLFRTWDRHIGVEEMWILTLGWKNMELQRRPKCNP